MAGSATNDRSNTGRVLAVMTALLLVAAGAIVALIYLPGPITPRSDHVPALRRLLNETRPASATVVETSDENQCESLENRAMETLQTSFDPDTMESLYRAALTTRSWRVHKVPATHVGRRGLVAEKRYGWGTASFDLAANGFGNFDLEVWYSCNSTD